MNIRLILSLILVFNSFLSLAQDDYYEEEAPLQENLDAYDSALPSENIQNKMEEKPLPPDAYGDEYYSDEPMQPEIEPYSENVDPYPQNNPYPQDDPYPDEPYPENTEAGNYDDSY